LHQVAIDDVTEDDFTIALHDLEAMPEPESIKRRWFAEQEPTRAQLLALAWFNNARKLVETGQSLLETFPGIGKRSIDTDSILHLDDEAAPHTRFDERISPHRVLAPFTFDIDAAEVIRAAIADATLSDIVLTVCSGALRRYLTDKGELPAESLYALVPLHEHPADQAGIPGHRVRPTRIRLMTDVDDALERLAMVREEMAEAKALKPITAEELSDMQDMLPASAMTFAARTLGATTGPGKRYRENHNTVISIHPGPLETLYLCGARLVGYTGIAALMDNLGLNHTVTTYEGKVTIAPVCDRHMMPDPAFYYACLKSAFDELFEAADLLTSVAGKRKR
jgi:WS/DGAT/MGAT family acyltransferase